MLGLILGDNLGLNSVLEFSKSFSALHFCQFCKLDKKSCQICADSTELVLRNKIIYEEDVKINDVKQTGIHKDSNSIKLTHFMLWKITL